MKRLMKIWTLWHSLVKLLHRTLRTKGEFAVFCFYGAVLFAFFHFIKDKAQAGQVFFFSKTNARDLIRLYYLN